MDETLEVMVRAWTEAPLHHRGKFYDLSLPELRPRPRQRPHPPIWRAVSSAGSVRECGRLGAPILIARVPLARVPERLALYADGLEESGLDAATRAERPRQAVLCQMTSGEMPHATSLASMRDFGERVIPLFR